MEINEGGGEDRIVGIKKQSPTAEVKILKWFVHVFFRNVGVEEHGGHNLEPMSLNVRNGNTDQREKLIVRVWRETCASRYLVKTFKIFWMMNKNYALLSF